MKKNFKFITIIFLLLIGLNFSAFASDISSLIKDLGNSNKDKAKKASGELTLIGKPAVPELIEALSSKSTNQRRYAARALRNIGQDAADAIPALSKSLEDSDIETRRYAAEALGKMVQQANEVIPLLQKVTHDKNKDVRESAEAAIKKLKSFPSDKEEIEKRVKERLNKAEGPKCTTVALTEESLNKYTGYVEFENGVKTSVIVTVSEGNIQYTFGKAIGGVYATKQKNLGDYYCTVKRWKDALKAYEEAVKSKSDYAEAYFGIGSANYELENYEGAKNAFEQSIKLNPDYTQAQQGLKKVNDKLELLKKQEKARIKILKEQEEARIRIEKAKALNDTGYDYLRSAKYQEATDSFKKAIETNPSYTEAYRGLGSVYFKLGNYEEAVKCYQQVIKEEPNDSEAYQNLSDAYSKMGNYQDAEKAKKASIRIAMEPLYRKYRHKYAQMDGKFICFPDFDIKYSNSRKGKPLPYSFDDFWQYYWQYFRSYTATDLENAKSAYTQRKEQWSIDLPEWSVGEYGRWYSVEVVQILGPDEMLVDVGIKFFFTVQKEKFARFKGWDTKKFIDGQSVRFDGTEADVAVVGTYKYVTVLGAPKTILDVVPLDLFRKGITLEQFQEMLKTKNDLPDDLKELRSSISSTR